MESLEAILARLVEGVPSAELAALGSMDGLLVEQHPPFGRDLAAAAAELTNVLVGVGRAVGRHLELGDTSELVVVASGGRALVRSVTPDLYLLLLTSREGDAGASAALDQAVQAVRELVR
jgi:predicted regulator of Ras-like GTPase activity (Roadblock/LC7/MglB family)